jgi:hypothetical protein
MADRLPTVAQMPEQVEGTNAGLNRPFFAAKTHNLAAWTWDDGCLHIAE